MARSVRPARLLAATACAAALMAAGCQQDSPEQEVPPGIFTTTLGDQVPDTTPTTTAPPGAVGY